MSTFMVNQQYKLLTMGDLYYSSDYDYATTVISTLTSSNQAAVKAQLDALAFATVGHINKFSVSTKLENEKVIRVGNCSVGEIDRSAEKTPTIAFEWLDVDNIDVFAKMLGLSVLTTAASPVTLTTSVIKPSGYAWVDQSAILIPYSNGDGTAITVTTVFNNVTTLTLGTDYEIALIGGKTYLVNIKGSTITATGTGINITGSYTPAASKAVGFNVAQESIPYGLYKFVSCPNQFSATEATRDTIYFVKFFCDGDMTEQYIDRVAEDFVGASMSFTGALGGIYLKYSETIAA